MADDAHARVARQYAFKPGRRVVYRWDGGGFTPVEVAVSRNSISRVVVEKGLAAGDRIALRDPTAVPRTPAAAAGPGGRGDRGP